MLGRLFVLIFGRTVGRIIGGFIGILAGIYIFRLLNGPDAAAYGLDSSNPTLRIVGYIVPLLFIVLGILAVVFGLIRMFPKGPVSPIAAVARLLFGVGFIGVSAYLLQSHLIASFFTSIPSSQRSVLPIFTYGIPSIFLLGGGLMLLWGLLGLFLGRAKRRQYPAQGAPFPNAAAPQVYNQAAHRTGTPQPYQQWGPPAPAPQPYQQWGPPAPTPQAYNQAEQRSDQPRSQWPGSGWPDTPSSQR